LLLGICSLG